MFRAGTFTISWTLAARWDDARTETDVVWNFDVQLSVGDGLGGWCRPVERNTRLSSCAAGAMMLQAVAVVGGGVGGERTPHAAGPVGVWPSGGARTRSCCACTRWRLDYRPRQKPGGMRGQSAIHRVRSWQVGHAPWPSSCKGCRVVRRQDAPAQSAMGEL